jgi:hypothetical protein
LRDSEKEAYVKRLVALLGVVVLVVSLALGLLGIVAGAQETPKVTYYWEYAVKVIVGKNTGTPGVAAGIHFTSVNIHCPDSTKIANYRVKVALSGDNGTPGDVSKFQEWRLEQDHATQWDMNGFYDLLTLSSITVPVFYEGFFVIESDVLLDVVAVYTGQVYGGDQLATMEIERVPYRYLGGGGGG